MRMQTVVGPFFRNMLAGHLQQHPCGSHIIYSITYITPHRVITPQAVLPRATM